MNTEVSKPYSTEPTYQLTDAVNALIDKVTQHYIYFIGCGPLLARNGANKIRATYQKGGESLHNRIIAVFPELASIKYYCLKSICERVSYSDAAFYSAANGTRIRLRELYPGLDRADLLQLVNTWVYLARRGGLNMRQAQLFCDQVARDLSTTSKPLDSLIIGKLASFKDDIYLTDEQAKDLAAGNFDNLPVVDLPDLPKNFMTLQLPDMNDLSPTEYAALRQFLDLRMQHWLDTFLPDHRKKGTLLRYDTCVTEDGSIQLVE